MFKEIGKFVAKFPLTRSITTRPVAEIAVRLSPLRRGLLYTRDQRLMMEARQSWIKNAAADISMTGLESWSGGVGPYGPGDLITLVEAVIGRQVTGERLDWAGRAVNLVAAAVPVLPGRPFVEALRGYRMALEDQVYKLNQKRASHDL